MRRFCLPILLLLSTVCSSQDIVLRVLGKDVHIEHAITNGVEVTFEEDPNKCDPRYGFVSIDQQLENFKEELKREGVTPSVTRVDDLTYTDFPKQSFRVEESDVELFTELLAVCNFLNLNVKKVYFRYPEHDYRNEDARAIRAFKHARLKAEILASHLNCTVSQVLNIDDDTNDISEYLDKYSDDPEMMEQFMDLLALLSGMSSTLSSESNRSTTEGTYHLWVTFALSPN